MPLPRVYADHAATSAPKPPGVAEALMRFCSGLGATPGRGGYAEAREAGEVVMRCRTRIRDWIKAKGPAEQVVFGLNCSDCLNLAIKGILNAKAPKKHAITTAFDHNSVLRPLHELREIGFAEFTVVPCDPKTGLLDPEEIRKAIRPDTGLIAVNHASNVTGVVQPIEAVGRIAHQAQIPYLVDAAQSLGHVAVDVEACHIDLLAAPGHKGLLGPQGTGFLWIRPGIEKKMRTLREGGTGTKSEEAIQPDFLPDRFEPGSVNALGIAGLDAALAWLESETQAKLTAHEEAISAQFLAGLRQLPEFQLLGSWEPANRVATFCVRHPRFPNPQDLSRALEAQFGILTRSGHHCAPLAHQALGTAKIGGATRLSFGAATTGEDVDRCLEALGKA